MFLFCLGLTKQEKKVTLVDPSDPIGGGGGVVVGSSSDDWL